MHLHEKNPSGRDRPMAISNEKKREIIQRLLVTKQKAHSAEILLRFQGMGEEADRVAARAGELSDRIDDLLGQVMKRWTGQSGQIVDAIRRMNASLQASVREIEKGVKTVQNAVKAVGYVDDAIEMAVKIIDAI